MVAAIGGIARDLNDWVRTNGALGVGKLAASAFISAFVGLIVGEIMMRLNPDWAFVAAGLGGFAGVKVLSPLIDSLMRRLEKWTGGPSQDS